MVKTRKQRQRKQRTQRKQQRQRTQRKQRGKGFFSSYFGPSRSRPQRALQYNEDGTTFYRTDRESKILLHAEIMMLQDKLEDIETEMSGIEKKALTNENSFNILKQLMSRKIIIQDTIKTKSQEIAEIELAEPNAVRKLRRFEPEPLVRY
jgi:hypothetical protein